MLYKKYGHLRNVGDKRNKKSTSGYCTNVGENIVAWSSKKQSVVSRSSAEADYRVMTHTTCKIMWLQSLLWELGFSEDGIMFMYCDNQTAIYIAKYPIFHKRISR